MTNPCSPETVESKMKQLLDFDDAGASDDEPVKGVTVGDIRAWHDEIEQLKAGYDKILDSWAECRFLLSQERQECAKWREDYARLDAKFEMHLRYPERIR